MHPTTPRSDCLQCTVDADFQKNLTPDGAVALLKAGALRSAGGKTKRSRSRAKLLAGAEGGQWPYAAVLSCIDSRAPVETIFDAETGDLFVARVAGNVASPDLVASLEAYVQAVHLAQVCQGVDFCIDTFHADTTCGHNGP